MRSTIQITRAILLILILLSFSTAFAQDEDEALTLRLSRDFGYGGGSRIQGRFSLRASGPENLVRVEFIIDGEIVSADQESPFRYNFNTGDYLPGFHELTAVGYLSDGRALPAITFTYEFLSAEGARSATFKLVVPILVILAAISLVGILGPVIFGKKKGAFRIGEYGPAGGAVCPRCRFPYARHILAPNLLVGKLGRCPHCGKWAIVRRATAIELEGAEARLQADNEQGRQSVERDDDQKLRRMLDESRFED